MSTGLLHALVDVHLSSPDEIAGFEDVIARAPIVVEALHVTGAAEYVVRVECGEILEIDRLVRALQADGGVRDVEVRLVLRRLTGGRPPAGAREQPDEQDAGHGRRPADQRQRLALVGQREHVEQAVLAEPLRQPDR